MDADRQNFSASSAPSAVKSSLLGKVYLSHLQARALYEALGRSLNALSERARQMQTGGTEGEGDRGERVEGEG